MNQHLGAAEAALKAGRRAEAITHLLAALEEDANRPLGVYRALLLQFYATGRFAEGERWSAKAVERFPRAADFWNLRGVFLRKLERYSEALPPLEKASKLDPKNPAPMVNRGNVLLEAGEFARAEVVFTKLARQEPRNAEHHRQLARALIRQGKRDAAMSRWRQAVALDRSSVDAWLDWAGALDDVNRHQEAAEVLENAVAANPSEPRLLEAKVVVMRRAGQTREAEAFLHDLLQRLGENAWIHFQLGLIFGDADRDRANHHFRRSVELEPGSGHNLVTLAESLNRTRTGDEGANVEEAYQLARRALDGRALTDSNLKVLSEILTRVGAYDELAKLGSMKDLGRVWAGSGRHSAFLSQLSRVRDTEDKLELLEQHRIWGRLVESRVAAAPIQKPPPRPADERIRIGFMSSDLRQHPVAYFALPLFDHIDPRFDVYCYSYFQGVEDPVQAHIRNRVAAFRWWPDISSRNAAQAIANDQLDILFELGGSTHMNKLDVMAYGPAPRQASWLGYPHSAGLAAIDYFVCDPYSAPSRPDLLFETPLLMPHSWLALGRMFSDFHEIEPGLPSDRTGRITFGTANNPHKYNRPMLALWARVLKSVPGSRFVFVRPEGGAASFVAHMRAEFAANGVEPDRVEFRPVRGRHMPYYNELDITLDALPLTGGTTTTEALWMGVPVVSLVGDAFYERLSFSILSNTGVGDLAASDADRFVEIAVGLAGDRQRRLELRTGLREMMKQSPLGRGDLFARDFYEMVAQVLAAPPPSRLSR